MNVYWRGVSFGYITEFTVRLFFHNRKNTFCHFICSKFYSYNDQMSFIVERLISSCVSKMWCQLTSRVWSIFCIRHIDKVFRPCVSAYESPSLICMQMTYHTIHTQMVFPQCGPAYDPSPPT